MPTAEYLRKVKEFKENCIKERTKGQVKLAQKTEKLRRQEKNKRMTNTHIFNLFDNRLQPIRDFHVGSGGRSDQDRVRVPPFFVEGRNPIHVEEMGWEAGETVHEIPERNRNLYRDFGTDVMEINRREIAVGEDEEDQAERVLERLVDKALIARRREEATPGQEGIRKDYEARLTQRIQRLASMKAEPPRGVGKTKRIRGEAKEQMISEELGKLYTKLRESEAQGEAQQEQNVVE